MALYDIARGLQPLDLGRTLGQIDQMQASRAQMDAFRTQQQQEAGLTAALPGAVAGLTSADPVVRNSSLLSIVQAGGTRGLAVAQPFLAQAMAREERDRQAPSSRTIDRNGVRVTQEWDPTNRTFRDVASSPIRVPGSGGAQGPGQIVQHGGQAYIFDRAQQRFVPAPGLPAAAPGTPVPGLGNGGEAQATQAIETLATRVARGEASPEEVQRYLSALNIIQQERIDNQGNRIIPRLPAYAPPEDWVVQRYGISRTPVAQAAPPDAAPPAMSVAPPGALGGAPAPAATPTPGAVAAPAPLPPGAIPGPAPGMTATPPHEPVRPAAGGRVEAPRQPSATERAKFNDAAAEVASIKAALETFQERFRSASVVERGQSALGQPTGLSTAWSNAALLAKGESLYNLGVLNGPDLEIIRRTLTAPDTLRGLFTGSSVVQDQVRQIVKLMEDRLAAKASGLGIEMPTARPGASTAAPAAPANPMGLRLPGAR